MAMLNNQMVNIIKYHQTTIITITHSVTCIGQTEQGPFGEDSCFCWRFWCLSTVFEGINTLP
jgi:hypothetical protein